MEIDLQQIINSPYTVRLVSVIGRVVPPAIAYPACNLIGKWAASRRQATVTRAVRINQWVVRGRELSRVLLDEATRETLQNNVRDLYELYHHLERPEVFQRRLCLNPLAESLINRPVFDGRGLVIVGIHLSNFDSTLISMIQRGAKALILTLPDPQGGRRVEFEMRKRTGMDIVPASLDALRRAAKHLERGGLVVTGIDRPVADARLQPRFFGQPAPLPTHHIFLAMKTRVPVVLMAVIRQQDGTYKVLSTEPMEMDRHADRETEILQNTERVLEQAERFIRLAPQQWNVPLPVWPGLADNMPD